MKPHASDSLQKWLLPITRARGESNFSNSQLFYLFGTMEATVITCLQEHRLCPFLWPPSQALGVIILCCQYVLAAEFKGKIYDTFLGVTSWNSHRWARDSGCPAWQRGHGLSWEQCRCMNCRSASATRMMCCDQITILKMEKHFPACGVRKLMKRSISR